MKKQKLRSEIDEKFKWDLTPMYKNVEEWNKDFNKIDSLINELIKYKGKITATSNNLYETLSKEDEIDRIIENLYIYAYLRYYEDVSNNENLILKGRIDKLESDVVEKTSFLNPELLEADYKLIEKYIKENELLKPYDTNLKRFFRQKEHVLLENEEKLLAGVGEIFASPTNIHSAIVNSDMDYGKIEVDGEKIEINNANYSKLIQNNNRKVRKEVFETYYISLSQYKNTIAETFRTKVKSVNFISKVRKYENPLQMVLYGDNIDVSVYDNLIKVVNSKLDYIQKYNELRKKELNLDELHVYDLNAPFVSEDNKEYSFDESIKLIKEGLKPLGKECLNIVNKAVDERWIDIYDNIGKKSGAFSWGSYDSNPYIQLNHNGTLDSVMTMAHELGHSMNTYLTNKTQSHLYHGHSIFTAEVTSIVNEILMSKYLLATVTDKQTKKIILNNLLDQFRGTIYRQTMFAEFEKTVFEKETKKEILTEEVLSNIYYDLTKKYHGDNVIVDELIRNEWMKIPHFYSPFYVYQYATGMCAAYVIANNIYEGKEGAVDNYIEFLSSGRNDFPIELLKKVGVDMTSTEPIEKALDIFDEVINEYINLDE